MNDLPKNTLLVQHSGGELHSTVRNHITFKPIIHSAISGLAAALDLSLLKSMWVCICYCGNIQLFWDKWWRVAWLNLWPSPAAQAISRHTRVHAHSTRPWHTNMQSTPGWICRIIDPCPHTPCIYQTAFQTPSFYLHRVLCSGTLFPLKAE